MRNLQRKAVAAHTYVLIFKKFRARIQIQCVIALIVDSRRIFFAAVEFLGNIIIDIEIRTVFDRIYIS